MISSAKSKIAAGIYQASLFLSAASLLNGCLSHDVTFSGVRLSSELSANSAQPSAVDPIQIPKGSPVPLPTSLPLPVHSVVPAPNPGQASPEIGVYRWGVGNGGVNIPKIAEFSKWLGAPAVLGEDFTDGTQGWTNMEGPGWDYGYWQPWLKADPKHNMILSYQMIPGDKQRKLPDGSTVSWAACGKGDYNGHYTAFAHSLMSNSVDHAYIRLAWEMDGDWYGSRVDPGEEADFAACFRQVVTTMRTAEPKSAWKFVINPTQDFHFKKPAGWFASVYPGDDVVDVIGIDLYDQTWDQNAYPYPAGCDLSCMQQRQEIAWKNSSLPGLTDLSDFAKKHGKPFAFPEWGLVDHVDGVQRGGLDNAVYIQHMYDFMYDPANNVVFQSYFDVYAGDGNHNISGGDGVSPFPLAGALFQKIFGAAR